MLGLAAIALFLLSLAPNALAGGPFHVRAKTLDITGLNHACGVATDSKGDLYLSSAGESKIKVYDPSHVLLTEIADANTPCGLAVTTTGNLYVSEQARGEVVRFKPNAYPFAGTPTYGPREVIDASGLAEGIAVDPFDNRLYVAEGDRVSVYGSEGSLYTVNEVQGVRVTGATGGTYTLEFEGEESTPIPFNATVAAFKADLETIPALAGNVAVTKPSSSYLVEFTGALAQADLPPLVADFSALTGSGSQKVTVKEEVRGFSGHLGEGALSEATGVAAYTYPGTGGIHHLWVADAAGADHLDLFGGKAANYLAYRRELNGSTTPDGSFGFGASGAYLAADPGNRSGEKCVAVSAQACSAGHLYLYDAEHKALDEFDASGEYLTQTENPAFADAEPTAVAIERSGGANDGTLYVTAGAAANAKALAFGPLKQPSRETLPKYPAGLSHELAGASYVATDSQGDLYALAESVVHVYGPDGAEIASFEDEFEPRAVAVDSLGNVYVRDFEVEEHVEGVTYYEPSSFPPEAGTTYSRFEPTIVTSKDFPESNKSTQTIAVIPGPAPGKDRLLVGSGGTGIYVRLYDTAAEGSTLLDAEFARSVLADAPKSIAVNGATGAIYFGINPSQVVAVDETGKELLARFDNKGSPSGKGSANPALAVEQASGHVVEYDGSTGSVHEYDAAGNFVEEFGSFTEKLSIVSYSVAVDNACALQEPPLTGQACEEFDPANGTVYVAFDDPSSSHPPYDVTAFGGLDYGTAPVVLNFNLKVKKTGSGSGTVTSSPAGISCGETCEHEYEEGEEVTLTAEALEGSEFAGWSGSGCSGTSTCKVTMSEAREVTAEFKTASKAKYKLSVKRQGSGTGTVTSSPPGINCGSECSAEYDEGTSVTLTGTPGANTKAVKWSGCDSETEGKCVVAMTKAKEVTATFSLQQHLLDLTIEGSGAGMVASSPAGVNCNSSCSTPFDHGTTVTLTASPEAGSTFDGWSGCDSEPEGKCQVAMNAARSVSVSFAKEAAKYLLSVTKAGSGAGTVSSEPAGIGCGTECSALFEEGTEVLLKATLGPNTQSVSWEGCDSEPSASECLVQMTSAREVKASFALEQHSLSVSKLGAGQGKVESSPSGIDCGGTCSAPFDHGSLVTLSATPEPGSEFRGWGGACSGTGSCEVTMVEAKEVTARFANAKQLLTLEKQAGGSEGAGTVTSKPKGIKCAGACSLVKASFYKGTEVVLTAKPMGETSTFSGWEVIGEPGACPGTGTCTVQMTEAKTVKALFGGTSKPIAEPQPLSVSKAGSGEGTLKASGLACEAACTETKVLYQGEITSPTLKAAKEVELTAIPAYGSTFIGWSGACSGTGTCKVLMKEARSVTASFTAKPAKTLTITKSPYPQGTGTVSSKPKGVKCATTCTAQEMSVPQGEVILLTEKPATGMEFEGWEGGGCAGKEPTCAVTVSASTTVKASFKYITTPPKEIPNPKELTLLKAEAGDGQGTVKASGLACEAACTSATSLYTGGTSEGKYPKPPASVTLEATPAPGSAFSGWTGCDSQAEGKCTVAMTEAREVTARFDQ